MKDVKLENKPEALIASIDGKDPKQFFLDFEKKVRRHQNQIQITINKQKLLSHVKRVCWPNLKKQAKICRNCPFKSIVLRAFKSLG